MKKSELYLQVLTKLSTLLDRHVGSPQDGNTFPGYQAFVWDGNRRSLDPVKRPVTIDHKDLIGIDAIKEEVIRNTRNFLEGLRSNSVLLWGERGTGKSSLVKSLL